MRKQRSGWKSGASKTVTAGSRHEAKLLFRKASERLLDVNSWGQISGSGSAGFRLTDAQGNLVTTQRAEEGHLIRIELPAPANKSGDGYDWVRIEAFEDRKDLLKDEERFGFRVRPVSNPQDHDHQSAHFYDNDATSTFLVIRHTNSVTALEQGRNEKPNVGAGGFFNRLRNLAVALFASLGLGKRQWQTLVEGLLTTTD